jgi:hypothetical protein
VWASAVVSLPLSIPQVLACFHARGRRQQRR